MDQPQSRQILRSLAVFKLPDSANYFLSHWERILDKDFLPLGEDIVRWVSMIKQTNFPCFWKLYLSSTKMSSLWGVNFYDSVKNISHCPKTGWIHCQVFATCGPNSGSQKGLCCVCPLENLHFMRNMNAQDGKYEFSGWGGLQAVFLKQFSPLATSTSLLLMSVDKGVRGENGEKIRREFFYVNI